MAPRFLKIDPKFRPFNNLQVDFQQHGKIRASWKNGVISHFERPRAGTVGWGPEDADWFKNNWRGTDERQSPRRQYRVTISNASDWIPGRRTSLSQELLKDIPWSQSSWNVQGKDLCFEFYTWGEDDHLDSLRRNTSKASDAPPNTRVEEVKSKTGP
jgi:hypothetical protein